MLTFLGPWFLLVRCFSLIPTVIYILLKAQCVSKTRRTAEWCQWLGCIKRCLQKGSCNHFSLQVDERSSLLPISLAPSNPLITKLMHPFISSFQVCTTESPAPHLELVLSPPLATSSSAPGSWTRCASAAATRRCVMDRARRSDLSHLLPPAWTHHGFPRFPSPSSCYPPSCADTPFLKDARRNKLKLYELNHTCFKMYTGESFLRYLCPRPGFLLQQLQSSGQRYHRVSRR